MPDNPVLIVCGSRRWSDRRRLIDTLDEICSWNGSYWPAELWHGGAMGADAMAGEFAAADPCRLPVRVWPADWARYGRAAGVRRSAEMIAAAPVGSLLVAFVPHRLADSVGTAHEVRLARKRGLAVVVVDCCGQQVLPADPLLPQLEVLL